MKIICVDWARDPKMTLADGDVVEVEVEVEGRRVAKPRPSRLACNLVAGVAGNQVAAFRLPPR